MKLLNCPEAGRRQLGWFLVAFMILVSMLLSIWLDLQNVFRQNPPLNQPAAAPSPQSFKGPQGAPYIIGPSGPPPGN